MAPTIEILRGAITSHTASGVLDSLRRAFLADGCEVIETQGYWGHCDWLVLFGAGNLTHLAAFNAQIFHSKKAMAWDFGYMGREKLKGYMRVTINHQHPQHLLSKIPLDDSRFQRLGVSLREDYDEDGPIILVGLGDKSRFQFLGEDWEIRKFEELQERFPGRRIVYRPKRHTDKLRLPCYSDNSLKIEDVLQGASLVVCRHSNVAVDAVIAGVPFEAEDGAAVWLNGKEYSFENRLEFLQRLAWFQWKPSEALQAWRFLKCIKI